MQLPRILAGTALAAMALAAPAGADETRSVWRVFIGDHSEAKITAFDLAAPETVWTFGLSGPPRLHVAAGGRVVVAVQTGQDEVAFLKSGLRLEAHGDHADLVVEPPSAVETKLQGPAPVHVVGHGATLAINFDGGGYATLLPLAALARGEVAGTEFRQSRPHHGFVTAFGDGFLSTVASDEAVEAGAAPPRLGLRAFDAAGQPASEVATCTAIHGEAFSGGFLAAGCREGVLLAREGTGVPEFRLLPYPAGIPEGTTGTLLGSPAMQVFLGNHGADGVVVIDPEEEPHMRRVALPSRRVDFVLDPAKPQFGYILTEDGSLHRLNLLDAAIEASATATEPYSMDGHWNDPRPRLAVAGDNVLVTDPRAGLLRQIDSATLAEVAQVPVGGQPHTSS